MFQVKVGVRDRVRVTFRVRDQTAENLGLHLSWQKTKVQNLGADDPAADIMVANNTVQYLSSIQSSSGRCYPDLH